jgi:cysteine-rich repeat protein
VAPEACDDGNLDPLDGCSAECAIEAGFECAGEPSVCASACGDGVVASDEPCDDGNPDTLDGCTPDCALEPGFQCSGSPSVCTSTCGDGALASDEGCDDGNASSSDGCSAQCYVEFGFDCTGEPSACTSTCGDGLIASDEACDDGGAASGDGCSAECLIESGFDCTGLPSECSSTCGDGVVASDEACDDGDATSGDGCSAACAIETGYDCAGSPSTCSSTCGDGVIASDEACDDGDTSNLDGCSSQCVVEFGWGCIGQPSVCSSTCGDGVLASNEPCDDGDTTSGDGCSSLCAVESGWSCLGQPSVCMTGCGDGIVAGSEGCDDGDTTNLDGCSSLCTVESGWVCTGSPSLCQLAGSCTTPIVASDGFVFQAPNPALFGDDLTMLGSGCVGSGAGTKPDLVFRIALQAGDTLQVSESGSVDSVMHVTTSCSGGAACLASFDGSPASQEVSPGLVYYAATAGNYFVIVDSYTYSAGQNFDLLFHVSRCGDGVVGPGEGCDDSAATNGDGCSSACQVEAGYQCAGAPSSCSLLPGAGCTLPIAASDGFAFTGSNIAQFGDLLDLTSPTCADVAGSPNRSPEIVFAIDLLAGQTLEITEHGTLDTVIQVLGTACGASSCLANRSDPDTTGASFVAPSTGTYYVAVESYAQSPSPSDTFDVRFAITRCGNGVVEAFEACDDGDAIEGNGCDTNCTVSACGNGILAGTEACDDGGTQSGNGCSATCSVESGNACQGTPSSCFSVSGCGNDIACYLGACPGGTIVTATASGVPVTIPDDVPNGGGSLTIPIAASGKVRNMVMRLKISHIWVEDVDVWLTGPNGGGERNVTTDNGGSGDNYGNPTQATFFRDGVAASITTGTAPFASVYRPEQPFSVFTGQTVAGNWNLRVADDAYLIDGQVTDWGLAFCLDP